ncbi:MAG: CoA-binding protein [Chloroflexota bacterium]|nr:CoA-binding protein [Chloroflexota bacterium]PLS80531.1 MAG: CoA-binding protein [Chloroflexota bacterium]
MQHNNSAPSIATDDELREVLAAARMIAVIGLSDDVDRPSYGVAQYLQRQGYRIIPVNPEISTVLGEPAYPDLLSVPDAVDIVDIFRRSSAVSGHVDEVIEKGAKLIWMQLGVRDDAAADRARRAGIPVITNRCLAVEHNRLVRWRR